VVSITCVENISKPFISGSLYLSYSAVMVLHASAYAACAGFVRVREPRVKRGDSNVSSGNLCGQNSFVRIIGLVAIFEQNIMLEQLTGQNIYSKELSELLHQPTRPARAGQKIPVITQRAGGEGCQ
jgi:hypothetical protein